MRSRWTLYPLLVAVVAVWGIVVWKIFSQGAETVLVAPQQPPAALAELPVTDTLLLDYPDPFLKGPARPVAAARPVVRNLPPVKVAPPRRERVSMAHLATVTSAGRPLYIVTIGDEQHELFQGQSAGEFVLMACDGDSLYLSKGGVTYGIELCD